MRETAGRHQRTRTPTRQRLGMGVEVALGEGMRGRPASRKPGAVVGVVGWAWVAGTPRGRATHFGSRHFLRIHTPRWTSI